MIKLLIGGSPCTHWSSCQTKNRETEPSGIGWELFENYLIALDKFRPDFFLYENNKSMSKAIREEITRRFGFEPVCINSALVSAQNRQRLYWCGKRNPDGTYSAVLVQQPENKGILLRDILESGQGGGVGAKTGLYAVPTKEEKIGILPNGEGKLTQCQSKRIYSIDAKGRVLNAGPGGLGVQTGLYAVPHDCAVYQDNGLTDTGVLVEKNKIVHVYEVRNGLITIKGKQYPIKLADGLYIIRKLTVTECKRLQTVPDSYVFPVSDTQAYKMLGNGWTVDVITHILLHCLGITDEPLDVLSMYDGMACGHIALDKLGAQIARYRATEIDKYAIKTACHNFPDIIQLGDAFQVRNEYFE